MPLFSLFQLLINSSAELLDEASHQFTGVSFTSISPLLFLVAVSVFVSVDVTVVVGVVVSVSVAVPLFSLFLAAFTLALAPLNRALIRNACAISSGDHTILSWNAILLVTPATLRAVPSIRTHLAN